MRGDACSNARLRNRRSASGSFALTAMRIRAILAVAAMAAGGCAPLTPLERLWSEGWREAVVLEVALGDRISKGAPRDCRKGLSPDYLASTTFLRASHRVSRLKMAIIVPVESGSTFHIGEKIHLNIKNCVDYPRKANP